jgi:hypothetical protein
MLCRACIFIFSRGFIDLFILYSQLLSEELITVELIKKLLEILFSNMIRLHFFSLFLYISSIFLLFFCAHTHSLNLFLFVEQWNSVFVLVGFFFSSLCQSNSFFFPPYLSIFMFLIQCNKFVLQILDCYHRFNNTLFFIFRQRKKIYINKLYYSTR